MLEYKRFYDNNNSCDKKCQFVAKIELKILTENVVWWYNQFEYRGVVCLLEGVVLRNIATLYYHTFPFPGT